MKMKGVSTNENQKLYRKKAKRAGRSVLAFHERLEKFSSRQLPTDRDAIENFQGAKDHCYEAFFVDGRDIPNLEAALDILKKKRYEIFSITIVSDKISRDYTFPRKQSLKKKFSYTLQNGKKIVRRDTLFMKGKENFLLANR